MQRLSNNIYITKTGIETVESFRNNPDIYLILMDIQMPEMDGYEATRQIRQFNTDVIIIAQNGFCAKRRQRKSNGGWMQRLYFKTNKN